MTRPNLLILLKARIKDDLKTEERVLVKLARALKKIPELDIYKFYSDVTPKKKRR